MLGLSWKAFRTLLTDYADVLGEQPENIPARHVSISAFGLLQAVLEMQGAGETPERIREALLGEEPVAGEPEDLIAEMEVMAATEEAAASSAEALPAATVELSGGAIFRAEQGQTEPQAATLAELADRVADMEKAMVRLEEALAGERHRSVKAIARLQQELQEIRYATITGISRRDRKKKGGLGPFGRQG